MKYSKIYLILIFFILFSCSENKNKNYNKNDFLPDQYFEYDGGAWSSMNYKIEERVIDNCEYIIIFGADSRNIIHKANCENTEHKSN